MNRTYLGPDANINNWFFQITTSPIINSRREHVVTIESGSATSRWKFELNSSILPPGLPDAMVKFAAFARALFTNVPNSDALENSEAFVALVEGYAKKQKMVLVTNNGRMYESEGPFNFSFKHFETTYYFKPDHIHENVFGLTFSGRIERDCPQPGYNHEPEDELPSVLQIFTRVIRRKTVLHAQLSRLSKYQTPNKPPAFEVLFQMEYK